MLTVKLTVQCQSFAELKHLEHHINQSNLNPEQISHPYYSRQIIITIYSQLVSCMIRYFLHFDHIITLIKLVAAQHVITASIVAAYYTNYFDTNDSNE